MRVHCTATFWQLLRRMEQPQQNTVIAVEDYPGLDARAFVARLPVQEGAAASPEWLRALLRIDAATPLRRDEATRGQIRELLRQRGYKPSGRGKPASEYLVRAAQ